VVREPPRSRPCRLPVGIKIKKTTLRREENEWRNGRLVVLKKVPDRKEKKKRKCPLLN